MRRIIVGVDGSDPSSQALLWAVREGELHGAEVHAVLTWGLLDQHHPGGESRFEDDYDREDAEEALDSYVQAAVGAEPAVPVTLRPVNDLPARGLLGATDADSLLVLGARGRGGFAGLLLGSVSQQCLHHSQCPVAVIRAGTEMVGHDPERIVVGVDGSDTARRALDWAAEEARVRGARLEVIHTWQIPYAGGYPYALGAPDLDQLEQAARAGLDRILDGFDESGLAQPVERIVTSGDPAAVILDVAQGGDLVVLGSRGIGGFKGLLLGSTAHHVVHHAACPVVVVPPQKG